MYTYIYICIFAFVLRYLCIFNVFNNRNIHTYTQSLPKKKGIR